MMTKLVMTRVEAANMIDRVSSNLRYNCERACELAQQADRDRERELMNEIEVRQSIQTLVQLLQVIDDQS